MKFRKVADCCWWAAFAALVVLIASSRAYATSDVAGSAIWTTYGLSSQPCLSCHTNAAGNAANLDVSGGFPSQISGQVPSGTVDADIQTAIRNAVNSVFAPRLAGSNLTVSKSAPSGTVAGLINVLSAGEKAFRPYGGAYSVILSDNSPDFTTSGSGVNWSLVTVGTRPFANSFGTVNVTVTSTNSDSLFHSGAARSATITVNLTNVLASLTNTNYQIVQPGVQSSVQLAVNNPDGDTLEYELLTANPGDGISISSTGLVSVTGPTPLSSAYSKTLTVRIKEASNPNKNVAGNFVDADFALRPVSGTNNAPVATTQTFNIAEAATVSGPLAEDIDGDALTYRFGGTVRPVGTAITLPHGTLTINAGNQFTYVGKVNDPAGDTFAFEASDGVLSDTGTLTFNKNAVDDPPTVKVGPFQRVIEVELKEQKSTAIDFKLFVTDPDTPLSQLRFRIVKIFDSESTSSTPATYGTFSPAVPGPLSSALLTYINRVDVALDFKIQFRVGPPGAAPSAAACTAASTDCGEVRVLVKLNGRGRHSPAERALLANQLGTIYASIPGNNPHFPKTEGSGACLNCHAPGLVTSAAPSCAANFFNEVGRRLCSIRPFQTPFDTRIRDAISGFINGQQVFQPMEPTIDISQIALTVPDGAKKGDAIGAPMEITTGLDLDGKVSRIKAVYLPNADARKYFEVRFTNLGSGKARGQLHVKEPLTEFSGKTIQVKPLPVNDGKRRTTASGDPISAPGFYPNFLTSPTIVVTVEKQRPRVSDDDYQTNNVAAPPFLMDVTLNDTTGGKIDRIEIVSGPAKGTAKVEGLKISFTADGQTGADSLTYRGIRDGVGASATNATVNLTIFDSDDAVAQPDGPYGAVLGETITLPVLKNDRGPKPFDSFGIVAAKGPQLGTAQFVNSQIVYSANKVGRDIFSYEVTGGGTTTEATVTVNVSRVSGDLLASATLNPELKPVARALGDTCRDLNQSGGNSDDQNDLAAICDTLAEQAGSPGSIDRALDQIRNEETLAAGDITMQQDRASAGNLLGRLDAVRGGEGRGLSFGQFALQVDGQTMSGSLIDATIEKASADGPATRDKSDLPWGVFLAGTVSLATQDSNEREAGFDLSGVMLTGGVDYALNERTLLGLAVSIGQSIADIGDNSGLVTRTGQVAAYGSFDIGNGLFIDGYGGLSFNSFEMERGIAFGGIDRIAQGSFDGEALSAAVRLKYATEFGKAQLETYGTLSYVAAWTDAYVERGAGGLNLAVGEQNFDALTGTIGVRLSSVHTTDFGQFTPYAGLAYARQIDSDGRSVTSSFAAGLDGSPTFTVHTESEVENFGSFEIGFAAETYDRSKFTMDLSGTFSDGGFEGYAAKVGISIPFGAPPEQPEEDVTEPTPSRRSKTSAKPKSDGLPAEPADDGADSSGAGSGAGGSSGGGGWN